MLMAAAFSIPQVDEACPWRRAGGGWPGFLFRWAGHHLAVSVFRIERE
jgi:hypothetical protein